MDNTDSMGKEQTVALAAAVGAGVIQLEGRKESLDIERKDDGSPVTRIDKLCEAHIRGVIAKEFPSDGFLGEETEAALSSNGRRWIVDPIDGTRPFIRGIPTHSVLIALEEDGEPVVGVIHLPAMGITCYASKGNGAFLMTADGRAERIRVSSVDKLSAAMGSTLGIVEYADTLMGCQLINFMKSLDYVYGFMDAYSYVLLASGKIDVCVNLLDKPWDCAAAACIITEAGGRYSSINGDKTIHAGSFVLTNGILHDEVLTLFRS